MKNLSEYIIKDGAEFFVDVFDADTNEPVFEDGEVFEFEYRGVRYKGSAVYDGLEVAQVKLQ